MDQFKVLGKNFVLNIAQTSVTPSGLIVTNVDPRKQRIKPDAFVGTVEECGSRCELVKPGMKVVIKRWEYRQHDLDDQRIVAQERELLILGDSTPAPNVVVVNIIPEEVKTNLALPQTLAPKKKPYHFGEVFAADCTTEGERIIPGDLIWVERRDSDQFFQGPKRLVVRNTPDVWNGDSPILAIGKRAPAFQLA